MKTIEEIAEKILSEKYSDYNQNKWHYDSECISLIEMGKSVQRWIPVEEELPEFTTIDNHNAVNVKFTTITGEERECTATLEQVSQHCFENSPYHNRWFVYPSGGHELKTVTHWRPIERK